MQAEIFVGVEISLPMEHPDFEAVVEHDTPVALGEFRDLRDEYFRHSSSRPPDWRSFCDPLVTPTPAAEGKRVHFPAWRRNHGALLGRDVQVWFKFAGIEKDCRNHIDALSSTA
jgi:hypothetical protein